jgi:hypothetical protein
MVLRAQGGRVYSYVDGLPDEEFAPAGSDRFASTERAVSFKLLRNPDGDVEAIEWNVNKTTRRMPRIGPLFSTLGPSDDPDPAFTRSVSMILNALAGCGKTVAQLTMLTQGLHNWCISLVNPVTRLRREALWRCRHSAPDRARSLWGSASSWSSRHAALCGPRSAVRHRNEGFATELRQRNVESESIQN